MQEMPAAKEEEEEEGSAHHPGKCMSQTNSTFTFTTCRILHPSDELTRVTPSLNSAPTPACGSTSHLKSTPVATPCTPRRLSLAESFTNIRESTTTMSTSLGLVWLLKERGISAAVYDPQSWDRAARGSLLHSYTPKMAVIPSTPPNSPMQTPTSSPPSFEFKCTSPPYDNFLASKPASSILREVREKKNVRSSESQTDVSVSNLNLVDKVRRFGVAKVVNSGRAHVPTLTEDQGPLLCGPPGPAQALVPGGGAIGGLQLSSGIRRNRSFPTMVGSSMHMKAPVTLTSGILMGAKLPKQTSLRPTGSAPALSSVQMVMESVLIFGYHSTGVEKACIYVISHRCTRGTVMNKRSPAVMEYAIYRMEKDNTGQNNKGYAENYSRGA
ncbi:trafficking kinesin-binding protein 1-like [Urocitellus parryii]